MKTKDLLVLILILLAAVGLAVLSQRHRSGTPRAQLGDLVFPGLAVNDVDQIRFETADDTISFTRKEDIWTAPDKYDYPLDFEKVRTFLLAMHDLKTGQLVTADEKQKAELRVISPKTTNTNFVNQTGTLVTIEKNNGTEIASMVLGKTRDKKFQQMSGLGEYPDGRYVAVDEVIYLVSSTFSDVPQKSKDWLAAKLVDVYTSDIMEVTVRGPKRDTIELVRSPDGGNLCFDKTGWGKEMDSGKVDELAGALTHLQFSDVVDPSLDDQALGIEKPVVWKARTREGIIYTVMIGAELSKTDASVSADDPDRHIRLSVACEQAEGESSEPPAAGTESDDKADATKKPEEQDKPAETAKKLNDKHSKWTYVIKGEAARQFLVAKKELTRKKQKQ